jgi:hypothetical protein
MTFWHRLAGLISQKRYQEFPISFESLFINRTNTLALTLTPTNQNYTFRIMNQYISYKNFLHWSDLPCIPHCGINLFVT